MGNDEDNGKTTSIIVCGVFGLLTLVAWWVVWPNKVTSNCTLLSMGPGFPVLFGRRGDISAGPENSLTAALTAVQTVGGTEMDITITTDSIPWLMRDETTGRLFDKDIPITSIDSQKLKQITFKQSSNGISYSTKEASVTLPQVLEETCSANPTANLMFHVMKTLPSEKSGEEMIVNSIFDSSCSKRDPSAENIFATESASQASVIKSHVRKHAPGKMAKWPVAIELRPENSSILGINFWLNTRLLHWRSGAEALTTHYSVFEKEKAAIMEYKKSGFCVGIYGGPQSKLELFYDLVDYAIVDTPESLVWDEAPTEYGGFYLVYTLSVFFCLALACLWLFMLINTLLKTFKKAKEEYSRSDYQKVEQKPAKNNASGKKDSNKKVHPSSKERTSAAKDRSSSKEKTSAAKDRSSSKEKTSAAKDRSSSKERTSAAKDRSSSKERTSAAKDRPSSKERTSAAKDRSSSKERTSSSRDRSKNDSSNDQQKKTRSESKTSEKRENKQK
eukprot:GHVL01002328.1.p1 GENE.GHVL01002328.1~~GHVL01002328.1.p1  ORF type:complete len:503 (+),score=78.35 GHVL01002328.1:76-1584(+)